MRRLIVLRSEVAIVGGNERRMVESDVMAARLEIADFTDLRLLNSIAWYGVKNSGTRKYLSLDGWH